MNINDIYNMVDNPLEQKSFFDKIMTGYRQAAGNAFFTNFYDQLVNTTKKRETSFNSADRDKFYVLLFNKWKNNLLGLSDTKIKNLISQNKVGNEIYEIQKYLRSIPDVHTKDDVDRVFNNPRLSEESKRTLEKYKWTTSGDNDAFNHICTHYVSRFTDPYPDVKHRLYLNLDKSDLFKVMNLIFEKCERRKMPFYFKYSIDCERDDCIIIYSDEESFSKYLEILDEIKREYPEIKKNSYAPPLLAGVIDGWIGYGTEPKEEKGKKSSFNSKRADVLESSINSAICNWIMNNKDKTIMQNGTRISMKDFIFDKVFDEHISRMRKVLQKQEESIRRLCQKNGTPFSYDLVRQNFGICMSDFNDANFMKNYYRQLKEKFIPELDKMQQDKIKLPYFDVTYLNGKSDTVQLLSDFKTFASNIYQFDPSFKDMVMSEIRARATKEGIDVSKFCFDDNVRKGLNNQRQVQNASNQQVQVRKQFVSRQQTPNYQQRISVKRLPREYDSPLVEQNTQNQKFASGREEELVKKQGYVGFRKPDAIRVFLQNPLHADWVHVLEGGEHRFFPPHKLTRNDTSEIINEFRDNICDLTYNYSISIEVLGSDRKHCKYTLSRTSRHGKEAGHKETIRSQIFEFDEEVLKVLIPTLYSDLCGNIPADTHERASSDYSSFNFIATSISHDKFLGLGNLSSEQLDEVIKAISFVDKKNGFIDDNSNRKYY